MSAHRDQTVEAGDHVAWLDVSGDGIDLRRSESESDAIGTPVWHLWVGSAAPEAPSQLTSSVRRIDGPAVIISRFSSQQSWVPRCLSGLGLSLLPAGNILYWGSSSVLDLSGVSGEGVLRKLAPEEVDLCRTAVRTTFSGYVNHYSVNPLFDRVSAPEAYADWATRCLVQVDHEVLAWTSPGGDLRGIGVTRRSGGCVEILLAGMLPAARGRGGYSAFAATIVNRALASGADDVVISTQDHNVPVQRLWSRLGLEPRLGVSIVHATQSP